MEDHDPIAALPAGHVRGTGIALKSIHFIGAGGYDHTCGRGEDIHSLSLVGKGRQGDVGAVMAVIG
jgi:hypothetical protein